MCSKRALWCFSGSPRCFHTARCSLLASTGHISSETHSMHRVTFEPIWITVKCLLRLCDRSKWTYSSFLHKVRDHDYDSSVLLPHHPPEVLECRLERALSSYISSGLVVALKTGEWRECCLLVRCNHSSINIPDIADATDLLAKHLPVMKFSPWADSNDTYSCMNTFLKYKCKIFYYYLSGLWLGHLDWYFKQSCQQAV